MYTNRGLTTPRIWHTFLCQRKKNYMMLFTGPKTLESKALKYLSDDFIKFYEIMIEFQNQIKIVLLIVTGLAAYFILVYYIYAVQLERELAETLERPEMTASDIAFIYPTKTDKQSLVLA